MATSQAQFDTDLTALGTAQTAFDATLLQLLTLIAQIIAKAQAGGVDLTTEDTAIKSIASDIATQQASTATALANIQAALNPPPPAA